MNVQHDGFTIERRLAAAPGRVFHAFADEQAKARWFMGPPGEWVPVERAFDFRIGGTERLAGRWASGVISDFTCHYHDIVADRRIVYSYDMLVDDRRISVSLAVIELEEAPGGTLLRLVEQLAFLDGYEDRGSRRIGTEVLLDRLAESLGEKEAAA